MFFGEGIVDKIEFDFNQIKRNSEINLKDILEDENDNFEYLTKTEYTLIDNPKRQLSGLIFAGYRNKKIRKNGVRENTKHLSRVHKQPNRIYSSNGTHPTLSSQEPTGRYFIYHKGKVRKLTLKECYRLMGFLDNFKMVGTQSKLYNRVGNSIVVPMVEEIAKQVKHQLFNSDYFSQCKPKQMNLFDLLIDDRMHELNKGQPQKIALS